MIFGINRGDARELSMIIAGTKKLKDLKLHSYTAKINYKDLLQI